MYQLINRLAFHIVIIEFDRSYDVIHMRPMISQVNHSIAAFLGYNDDELIGRPLEQIFCAGHDRLFHQPEPAEVEGNNFEGQLITKSGSRVNVLVALSRMPSEIPNSDQMLVLFHDINGKRLIDQEALLVNDTIENSILQCREVESALAESEERFRQMAEMTGEWLWEQDHEGYYIYSSTAVNQILGYSQEKVVGKHYTELLTPQDKASQQNYATSRQPFYSLTNHYRHKDGHLVITESTGLPISDVNGKLIKWRGADRDITARKHFQDALIESEKRIRLIIESSINAIVIMDSYGIITDWNRQAEMMFGWSGPEAIGRRLDELIIPVRFRKAHRSGLQQFLQTGVGSMLNRQIEQVALRRDGTEFPVELSVSPLKLGNSYVFSGFVHDITSRKKAEQQIRQAQINLAINQNEIRIAQQIQSSLLPSVSIKASDFEVKGFCLPADKVGGDYFDYFFRGDNFLDIVIADVSGHSIGPSLFMVETRSAIRAQANRAETPSETLAVLNNFLYHDLNNSDFFISLFYLQYDINNKQLRYANAGHPPPLLFSFQHDKCMELDAEGLILGVHKNVTFEEKIINLAENDVVLLYTDGLTEAENAGGEHFGLERVREIFVAHSRQPLQEIIDALLTQLKLFCQSEKFNDDITLMVFKRGE